MTPKRVHSLSLLVSILAFFLATLSLSFSRRTPDATAFQSSWTAKGSPSVSLADASGAERIVIGYDTNGSPFIALSDPEAQRRVVLAVDGHNGPALSFYARGIRKLHIHLGPNELPSISLGTSAEPVMSLGISEVFGPSLSLGDLNEGGSVLVASGETPHILIRGLDKTGVVLGVFGEGGPQLVLQDRGRDLFRVETHQKHGKVSVLRADGTIVWSAPK